MVHPNCNVRCVFYVEVVSFRHFDKTRLLDFAGTCSCDFSLRLFVSDLVYWEKYHLVGNALDDDSRSSRCHLPGRIRQTTLERTPWNRESKGEDESERDFTAG